MYSICGITSKEGGGRGNGKIFIKNRVNNSCFCSSFLLLFLFNTHVQITHNHCIIYASKFCCQKQKNHIIRWRKFHNETLMMILLKKKGNQSVSQSVTRSFGCLVACHCCCYEYLNILFDEYINRYPGIHSLIICDRQTLKVA